MTSPSCSRLPRKEAGESQALDEVIEPCILDSANIDPSCPPSLRSSVPLCPHIDPCPRPPHLGLIPLCPQYTQHSLGLLGAVLVQAPPPPTPLHSSPRASVIPIFREAVQKQHEGSIATSSGDIVQAYAGALGKAQSENWGTPPRLESPGLVPTQI